MTDTTIVTQTARALCYVHESQENENQWAIAVDHIKQMNNQQKACLWLELTQYTQDVDIIRSLTLHSEFKTLYKQALREAEAASGGRECCAVSGDDQTISDYQELVLGFLNMKDDINNRFELLFNKFNLAAYKVDDEPHTDEDTDTDAESDTAVESTPIQTDDTTSAFKTKIQSLCSAKDDGDITEKLAYIAELRNMLGNLYDSFTSNQVKQKNIQRSFADTHRMLSIYRVSLHDRTHPDTKKRQVFFNRNTNSYAVPAKAFFTDVRNQLQMPEPEITDITTLQLQ